MPISDWISDVCFSDPPAVTAHHTVIEIIWTLVPVIILVLIAIPSIGLLQAQYKPAPDNAITLKAIRSEEHTSELQSLMRISYAVFCLKKKRKLYRPANKLI